jgi:hypothetical protein
MSLDDRLSDDELERKYTIEELEENGLDWKNFASEHDQRCPGILTFGIIATCGCWRHPDGKEPYYSSGGVNAVISCHECKSTISSWRSSDGISTTKELNV